MKKILHTSRRPFSPGTWVLLALTICLMAAGFQMIAGCAANEPFDPLSLENHKPTVGMSVSPPEVGEFPATSYFMRTFYWHGSDQDGFVENFDLSIRLDADVEAPWVTTTKTDTLMTFATDDNGEAEAVFLLVARDNLGALSDTLRQTFPLRNFPPEIFFDPDFDPQSNLQREVVPNGAVSDTLFWNWGYSNFKLVASDPDGVETMDQFYRYTFADTEPTETYLADDPLADPETTWVQDSFNNAFDPTTGFRDFEIYAADLTVGMRTLTISVVDEGGSDTRFEYSWDVRAPRSNILYIRDNSSSIGRQCYTEFLDGRFGAGNWDSYDFWMGYPDRHITLAAVMRKYDAVLWTDGGGTSDLMVKASEKGGALQAYVEGTDTEEPGKLMLISSVVAGTTSRLGAYFRLNFLGIRSDGAPVTSIKIPAGRQALGEVAGLEAITSENPITRAIGLRPLANGEVIYRLEECAGCYARRPPFDPVVGVRSPLRTTSEFASTVSVSTQLEYFNRTEVLSALNYLFDVELGVVSP